MTISEIAREVTDSKGARLIRYRKDSVKSGVAQYDCKELFTGNKRGWNTLDLFTASALVACYDALKPENQAKFNNLPLGTLVSFCFKQVA